MSIHFNGTVRVLKTRIFKNTLTIQQPWSVATLYTLFVSNTGLTCQAADRKRRGLLSEWPLTIEKSNSKQMARDNTKGRRICQEGGDSTVTGNGFGGDGTLSRS